MEMLSSLCFIAVLCIDYCTPKPIYVIDVLVWLLDQQKPRPNQKPGLCTASAKRNEALLGGLLSLEPFRLELL